MFTSIPVNLYVQRFKRFNKSSKSGCSHDGSVYIAKDRGSYWWSSSTENWKYGSKCDGRHTSRTNGLTF